MLDDRGIFRYLTALLDASVSAEPVEPVSLEETREYLKLDTEGSPPVHEQDDEIEGMIQSAREWAERESRCTLVRRGRLAVYRCFPSPIDPRGTIESRLMPMAAEPIYLPTRPLVDVASVRYYDETGADVLLDASRYNVTNTVSPAIELKVGDTWPSTYPRRDAVRVEFTAGFDPPGSPQDAAALRAAVPRMLRTAILLHVMVLFESLPDGEREAVMKTANMLVRSRRVHSF